MSDEEFAGLGDDLDGVIPDKLVDDTYLCRLSNRLFEGKDGRRWWALSWSVEDEGPYYHEEIREMFQIFSRAEFESADPDEQVKMREGRRRRFARLESLGVPRERFGSVSIQELDDIMAYLTVQVRPKTKGTGDNVFVNGVELANSVESQLSDFSADI